eukprot:TRINITY_DN610_c0_g1_i11.p1 TRINITY_DN610_c0_g1~~TRINITY_DN610_c0_g1_i11.p1  ORF type:complete len:121 (+),score=46.04 TRINITY_DN610_c0_g1_i11:2-364(+)
MFFFFNDTATTEIYTEQIVGSVRCVQETGINAEYMGNKDASAAAQYEHSKLIRDILSNMSKMNEQEKSHHTLTRIMNLVIVIISILLFLFTIMLHSQSGSGGAGNNNCLLYTSPSPRDQA